MSSFYNYQKKYNDYIIFLSKNMLYYLCFSLQDKPVVSKAKTDSPISMKPELLNGSENTLNESVNSGKEFYSTLCSDRGDLYLQPSSSPLNDSSCKSPLKSFSRCQSWSESESPSFKFKANAHKILDSLSVPQAEDSSSSDGFFRKISSAIADGKKIGEDFISNIDVLDERKQRTKSANQNHIKTKLVESKTKKGNNKKTESKTKLQARNMTTKMAVQSLLISESEDSNISSCVGNSPIKRFEIISSSSPCSDMTPYSPKIPSSTKSCDSNDSSMLCFKRKKSVRKSLVLDSSINESDSETEPTLSICLPEDDPDTTLKAEKSNHLDDSIIKKCKANLPFVHLKKLDIASERQHHHERELWSDSEEEPLSSIKTKIDNSATEHKSKKRSKPSSSNKDVFDLLNSDNDCDFEGTKTSSPVTKKNGVKSISEFINSAEKKTVKKSRVSEDDSSINTSLSASINNLDSSSQNALIVTKKKSLKRKISSDGSLSSLSDLDEESIKPPVKKKAKALGDVSNTVVGKSKKKKDLQLQQSAKQSSKVIKSLTF